MFRIEQGFLALVVLLACGTANAQFQVRANEMPFLPKYCEHAQTFPTRAPDGVAYWTARLGPAFHHIHHYCWALSRMHRAQTMAANDPVRNGYYDSAIKDIDYFIQRAEPNFVLLPEMLTRRGEALAKLKRHVDAETTFSEAIERKPDYWPAYKGLANTYLDQSRVANARETLNLGISKSSDPRMLERMLNDLPKK